MSDNLADMEKRGTKHVDKEAEDDKLRSQDNARNTAKSK